MLPIVDPPRMRSFIAIRLADPARATVVAYLEQLRATVGGVAWARPENLHLTFKFLGDVACERLPPLVAALRPVAASVQPFTLRVAGVGAFPSLARPRVLWVGVAAPVLPALAAAVERACRDQGFALEARAFRPHLTLGRVRSERHRSRTWCFFGASSPRAEPGIRRSPRCHSDARKGFS